MSHRGSLVLLGHNQLTRRMVCHATAAGWHVAVATHDPGTYRDPCDRCEDIRFVVPSEWTFPGLSGALRRACVTRITAVYSTVDQRIPLAIELASALGARAQGRDNSGWQTDKLRQSELLQAEGLPLPRSAPAATREMAVKLADDIGYPVILKPRDMNGSRHVCYCESAADVAVAWDDHAADLVDRKHSLEFMPDLLVQEFLQGPVYSVETLTDGAQTLIFGVTDRVLSPLPHFAELGAAFPADCAPQLAGQMCAMAGQAVTALGVIGPAHTEFVAGESGPVVIEVNGRMPGSPITTMVGDVTGVNLYDATLEILAGGSVPAAVHHDGAGACALEVAPTVKRVRDVRDGVRYVTCHAATVEQAREKLANLGLPLRGTGHPSERTFGEYRR